MRPLTLGAISALLLSFSSRPWGSSYFALVAFIPVLIALFAEKSIWRGAVITYISALPVFIIGFEGLVVKAPLTYYGVVFTVSLYFLLPGAIMVRLHRRFGSQISMYGFAASWVAVETLSGSVKLWHNWANPLSIGLSQIDSPLAQLAFWAGVPLVSFYVFAFNIGLYFLLKRNRIPLIIAVTSAVIFCTLPQLLSPTDILEPTKLAVVQGQLTNIEMVAASFSFYEQEKLIERYLNLTNKLRIEHPDVDLVVWPETAVGWYMDYVGNSNGLKPLFPQNLTIVSGGYRSSFQGLNNSVIYWNGEDHSLAYEKELLVPIYEDFLISGKGYSDGLLQISNQEIGLGICWESLYPELSRRSVKQGADLLIFIADDTFAGQSITPWGHMRTTSMRAIESGRPAVFASQAGPSGVFAATGSSILTTEKGEGYWLAEIPQVVEGSMTPFVRFGNWFGWACLLTILALLASCLFKDYFSKQ